MLERDPDLLEYLEGCCHRRFDGFVNRVVWADRSPIQGSNSGRGRMQNLERNYLLEEVESREFRWSD